MYVNFGFKRTIKYLLYFAIGFLCGLFMSNANAYELNLGGGKVINEEFIYNSFASHYSDFSMEVAPYIFCTSGSGNYICTASDKRFIDTLSIKVGSSWSSTMSYVASTYNFFQFMGSRSNSDLSYSSGGLNYKAPWDGSYVFSTKTPYSASGNYYGLWTNFDISSIPNSSGLSGTHNVFDFSPYEKPKYMTISYLDSDYSVLNSKNCTNNSDPACTLTVNNNNGKYIKVHYYIDKLLGNNLDLLNNFKYKISVSLLNSLDSVQISQLLAWYHFADSIDNTDSSYLMPVNLEVSSQDEKFDYTFDINFKSDYDTVSLYEFDIYYNFSDTYISSVSVPYTITINDVTGGGGGGTTYPETPPAEDDTNQKLDDINNQLGDINNNLTNSDTSGATSSAGDFFNNFEDKNFGLSDIITMPLQFINNITSSTCEPLNLQVPFVDQNLQLPCMREVYEDNFGSLLTIYQIITGGIISYWICVQIYALVKGFKDPDKDEIEVMDL